MALIPWWGVPAAVLAPIFFIVFEWHQNGVFVKYKSWPLLSWSLSERLTASSMKASKANLIKTWYFYFFHQSVNSYKRSSILSGACIFYLVILCSFNLFVAVNSISNVSTAIAKAYLIRSHSLQLDYTTIPKIEWLKSG